MTGLAKLKITPEDEVLNAGLGFEAIPVLFNPNTYSITKGVSWTDVTARPSSNGHAEEPARAFNAPELQFSGGQGRSLSLSLFYDTTGESDDAKKDVRLL